LAGGASAESATPLPDYVPALLSNEAPVFFQAAYGIPDDNDAADWAAFRAQFGLPGGDTQTLGEMTPEVVDFDGASVRWGGWMVTLVPILERLLVSEVDTAHVEIPLSAEVLGEDIALLLKRGDKVLINSNLLHLEASYALNRLFDGPLRAPVTADVVVASDRVLIYAEYEGTIDIDLPWSGHAKVRRDDAAGAEIQNEVVDLGGRYVESLSRGEFVFLCEAPAPAIPAASTWGCVVMILLVLTVGTVALRRAWFGVGARDRAV
jgi:hypothetical protein